MRIRIKKENGKLVLNKLFSIIILLDICCFPYIRILRSLFSMILLITWYLFNLKKISLDKEMKFFLISIPLVLISAMLGYMYLPKIVNTPTTLHGNITGYTITIVYIITYTIMFIFTYLYYFYFKNEVESNLILKKILPVLLTIFTVMAIVYLYSPMIFFSIRSFWTLSGTEMIATLDTATYYRFTGPFSDPNNTACISIAIAIYIFENKLYSDKVRYMSMIMCAVILMATMSSTGVIAFVLYVLAKIMISIITTKKIVINRKKIGMIILFFIVCIIGIIVMSGNSLVKTSLDRITNNSDSANIRFEIWEALLKGKWLPKYILSGFGNIILLNNKAILPHNGHLYLIYSYGLIVYLIFIYVFFRKRKNVSVSSYLYVIPLFLCFTMNVGLIDARYTFLMGSITGIFSITSKTDEVCELNSKK